MGIGFGDMRDLIDLVEALSRHATPVPGMMQGRTPTPAGTVLFHGTPLDQLVNILKTNVLWTGINWRGEGDRVALTRSYTVAYSFGEQGDFSIYPSVLVLDWEKLSMAFQIVPHSDFDAEGNHWQNTHSEDRSEQEEAVYGNIRPLGRFLISVNIEPVLLRQAMTDKDFVGWVIEEKGWARTPHVVHAMLQAILAHPKLNVWHP